MARREIPCYEFSHRTLCLYVAQDYFPLIFGTHMRALTRARTFLHLFASFCIFLHLFASFCMMQKMALRQVIRYSEHGTSVPIGSTVISGLKSRAPTTTNINLSSSWRAKRAEFIAHVSGRHIHSEHIRGVPVSA